MDDKQVFDESITWIRQDNGGVAWFRTYPYPIVDSWVSMTLSQLTIRGPDGEPFRLSHQWKQTSAGSTVHTVVDADGNEWIHVLVRAFLADRAATMVLAHGFSWDPAGIEKLQGIMQVLRAWEIGDKRTLASLKEQGAYPPESVSTSIDAEAPPQPKRSPGAPPDPINEWARREIRLGRDRQDVFNEYLGKHNVDTNNKQAVSVARDRFRKALGRKSGRK